MHGDISHPRQGSRFGTFSLSRVSSSRASTFPLSHFATSALALLLLSSAVLAQSRPTGTIHSNTVWSGTIEIADTVTIAGATVRVQPGSTIRFLAATKGRNPSNIRLESPLFIAGERSRTARLILAGTADQPVTVETVQDAVPGGIDVSPGTSSVFDARFVNFRRLGSATDEGNSQPAILIQVADEGDFWLTDCTFEACGPVQAGFIGRLASGDISRCTFRKTVGTTALVLMGAGSTGIKTIRDNIADAAFEFGCSQTLAQGNVLIGPAACIAVRRSAGEGVRITGNYVHCTTEKDLGRYAMRCDSPTTIVENNVLAGGSYVLETAPHIVRHNVLIGASNLVANLGAATTSPEKVPPLHATTHAIVTNMCPHAALTDNLLLGPAYAAISLAGPSGGIHIENNTFDGWGLARHAVQFDITTTGSEAVAINRNLLIDYLQPPIVRDATAGPQLSSSSNTFVGMNGPVYKGFEGLSDLAAGDSRVATTAQLSPPRSPTRGSPATQAAADVDDQLRQRQKMPTNVLHAWFAIYASPSAAH